MKTLTWILAALLAALAVGSALAQTADPRYCGPPARDVNGIIIRSSHVLSEFKHLHPCPVTGQPHGACPGWSIDHVLPLADGGCDAIGNLQWLPNSIKSCADPHCKDRWERKINAQPMVLVP